MTDDRPAPRRVRRIVARRIRPRGAFPAHAAGPTTVRVLTGADALAAALAALADARRRLADEDAGR